MTKIFDKIETKLKIKKLLKTEDETAIKYIISTHFDPPMLFDEVDAYVEKRMANKPEEKEKLEASLERIHKIRDEIYADLIAVFDIID